MSKLFKIIYTLIYLLFLVAVVFLGIEIYTLNLLPNKYLLIILGVLLIIIVLFTILFIKIKKLPLKIISAIIQIIIAAGSIFGITYLNDTNNFFNNLKTVETETDVYYVIVDKNSNYNTIDDLENKTIGLYMENKKATEKLKNEINFKQKKLETTNEVTEDINK